MFAKSIRIVFSKNLFKTSIKLLYKMLDVFAINSKISFFIFISFRLFSIFFLLSHSFRSFQLRKWIVLTFINKSFQSLIVSILNLSFRNEIEKRREINCSNVQSRNIKISSFRIFTFKITYKTKKKSTIVVFDRFVYFICIIKTRFLYYFKFYYINQSVSSYMFQS